jgi:hypothetical protein
MTPPSQQKYPAQFPELRHAYPCPISALLQFSEAIRLRRYNSIRVLIELGVHNLVLFYWKGLSTTPKLTSHHQSLFKMPKIAQIEYFRVPPRWLFVKITDDAGNVGWGEASLEGHTQAVEGCLDAYIERYAGMDAE